MSCQYPYPAEKLGDYKAQVRSLYAQKGIPYPDQDSENWFSQWGYDCGAIGYDAATASQLQQIKDRLGIVPPEPVPPDPNGPTQPLNGYLRAVGSVWHDDAGPVAPRLCSYFPAIRVYRDNPTLFKRNLDSMVGYWHGARIFWCLRGVPWESFALEVDVTWPNYDQLFVAVLNEFHQRGLRVALTSGTLHSHQLPNIEQQFERIGNLCASVNQQTVAWHSVINEPGVTSPYGDGYDPATDRCSGQPWVYYRKLLDLFRAKYPWNHHGTGCQGGDPEATSNGGGPSGVIYGSQRPATMACVQGTRGPNPNPLERAFDMGYRVRPATGVPVLEEEPSGNNGMLTGPGSVTGPMNNRDELFAYYAVKLFTGQALISLNSCGLCEQNPLDSVWGFKEIPQLLAQIGLPNDIGTYRVGNLHQHPITASGVYRCDGSWHDGQGKAFAIAHGGSNWKVTSRWDAQARVYRADGLHLDKHVSAGGEIFSEGGAPVPTVITLTR